MLLSLKRNWLVFSKRNLLGNLLSMRSTSTGYQTLLKQIGLDRLSIMTVFSTKHMLKVISLAKMIMY